MVYIYFGLHRYYGEVFPASGKKDAAILDLCSSWISHYPKGYTAGRIAGDHQSAGPRNIGLPIHMYVWLSNTTPGSYDLPHIAVT